MSNKKLDELLAKLEATEADLSQRADQASEAASENRRKRERALQAFKAASVKGDQKAQAEAADLVKQLDGEFELKTAETTALLQALEGAGPLRPICLAIKAEAEAQAKQRQEQWSNHAARLKELAAEYLAEVAAMGKLHQTGAGHHWEIAKNHLGRADAVLAGGILPAVVHENQRGSIYQLPAKSIEQSFRQARSVTNG